MKLDRRLLERYRSRPTRANIEVGQPRLARGPVARGAELARRAHGALRLPLEAQPGTGQLRPRLMMGPSPQELLAAVRGLETAQPLRLRRSQQALCDSDLVARPLA